MYTNLLLFLVAIFVFTVDGVPEEPMLSAWLALPLFIMLLAGYSRLATIGFARLRRKRAGEYFKTEKYLAVCALVFFALVLYFCDAKYYLSLLPLATTIPSLVNFAGLALFVVFLAIMWRAGRPSYSDIFGRSYTSGAFIKANIRANLPIVLPWLAISLCYDLLALLPIPGLQELLASDWGDMVFFGTFLIFIVIFFPPLVRYLWGCRKLPDGYLQEQLKAFCAKHNFKADFYLWPLFEGRVLTAGVMGVMPGLRYILITPALIETMTLAEMEAVMAHEIAHVKKYHLLLYVLLIGCFSVLAGVLAEPCIYYLLSLGFVTDFIVTHNLAAESVLTTIGAVPLLFFMLFYFRLIFGYFIRNFERQADLYSLAKIGTAGPLVSAFEKIAVLSGNIRDEKNWHHFGIGERIDCLLQAEQQSSLIDRHNRKVRYSLFAYIIVVGLTIWGANQIPTEQLANRYQDNLAETVLLQKVKQEPDQAIWLRLIGDLMFNRKMEKKALAAYEKALAMEPNNPEILNNYAWLLLTAEDLQLRDPSQALTLARSAAIIAPKGHVLDTLATAYWANGFVEEAVQTERKAIAVDASQHRFYQAQIAKFTSTSYEDSIRELKAGQKPQLQE
jgi:Zn-dependent protease with chaperone function